MTIFSRALAKLCKAGETLLASLLRASPRKKNYGELAKRLEMLSKRHGYSVRK